MVYHNIEPIFNEKSKILILGSFPSVKSREQKFFYGHPQNRFWKVTSNILGKRLPETVAEKKEFLLNSGIALWDVIASCEISGSADSSVKSVTPNDISDILKKTNIERIFVNGKTAEKYYIKYIEPKIKIKAVCLPSTSPANAMWSLEKLQKRWAELILNKGEIL